VTGAETGAWAPSARQLERESVERRRRRRRTLVAVVVTIVVFGAVVVGVTSSPGWPTVKATFFDWSQMKATLPDMLHAFWRYNILMFLVAEPLILLVGILVAVTRHTVSPWLTPLRIVAVAYTDLFRGLPTILVVTLFGFGIPALGLTGVTTSLFWLALVALVLCYGAYVAEVVRAGIDSVHPTQLASAEALALSRGQAMWHVILPQALRRVVPPLVNDFVSLQKDTALVSVIGVFEVLRVASDYGNYHFNYSPLILAGVLFVIITIPIARFTDWLSARARRREWGRA
jgi:polar amino acid transport system permease protein